MNIKQKQGLANVGDKIAIGMLFIGIGGWFTDTVKWYTGLILIIAAIAAYIFAFILRKDRE